MANFHLQTKLQLPPVCVSHVLTKSLSSTHCVRVSVYSVLIFLNILSGALTVQLLLLLAWPDLPEAKHRKNTKIHHLF